MSEALKSTSRVLPAACAYPSQQRIIDLTGEVVPCCFWSGYGNVGKPLGNPNVNTIDEIWNSPEYRGGLNAHHPEDIQRAYLALVDAGRDIAVWPRTEAAARACPALLNHYARCTTKS